MAHLIVSVIIVLLSVLGSNAQCIESEKTPSEDSCNDYYLCTSNVRNIQTCTSPNQFNMNTLTCGPITDPDFLCFLNIPSAPIEVPTAPVTPDVSTTVSITTTIAELTTTSSTIAGETTTTTVPTTVSSSTVSVPTVPTVSGTTTTTAPITTTSGPTTVTTGPTTISSIVTNPTQQTTPPPNSGWPTGPITCNTPGLTYHGHHIRCDQFQICNSGQYFLRTCPNLQHWAPHLNRCDWPNVANCPHVN